MKQFFGFVLIPDQSKPVFWHQQKRLKLLVGSTFLFKFSFLQLILFHNTHHTINIFFIIRTCFSLHPFLLDWECDFHLQWSWDNWWTGRVWFGRLELVCPWCLYTGAEDWTFYFFWQWTCLWSQSLKNARIYKRRGILF